MKYVASVMWVILALSCVCDASEIKKDQCVFYRHASCVMCDELKAFEVGDEANCTNLCPNREVNHVGSGMGRIAPISNNCVLRKCPADFPLRDNIGNCYACDEDILQKFENCESVCPNRHLNADGACEILKKYAKRQKISEQQVNLKRKCLNDKPLKDWQGCGHDCEEAYVILDKRCGNVMANCESRCPNRFIEGAWRESPTSVLRCGDERPLVDSVGFCWSCDTDEIIDQKGMGDECEQRCKGKRYLADLRCLKCPEDKTALEYESCRQCGGLWKDGRCEG